MKHFFLISGYHNKGYLFFSLPPHVLEISTTLHVALLVFLRHSALKSPFVQTQHSHKHRCMYITIIWLLSVLYCITALSLQLLCERRLFLQMKILGLHCYGTVPVIAIMIMWIKMIKAANNKHRKDSLASKISSNHSAESNDRFMSTLVKWLVIILLLCYVPFLAWKQYFYGKLLKRVIYKSAEPLYDEKVSRRIIILMAH